MARDRLIETRDDLDRQVDYWNRGFADALNRTQQDAKLLVARETRSVAETARDSTFFERERAVASLAEIEGRFDGAVTEKSVLSEGLMNTTTSGDQMRAHITCDSGALPSGERRTQRTRRLLSDEIRGVLQKV